MRGGKVYGNGQTEGQNQHIDQDAQENGNGDDRTDVDGGEADAELADDNRDGARIGCRSGHEEDQGGPRAESLGHQGSRNRCAGRCADVEGNTD